MKKQDFLQVKGLDLKELKTKTISLRKEIADLTLDKNMKKMKDLKLVSKKKKELAQVLTVMKQKELLVQLESSIESKQSLQSDDLQEPSEVKKGKK